jgi:hypothetical protein
MYKDNFIVVVRSSGRIMRELDGVVKLPFGSEYELLLKNKDSRKAVVGVEIDGVDVLSGRALIVHSNSQVELKGFMDGMTVRNAFKFIHKTQQIADHRGDRIDDGLIRVSFRYEKTIESHIDIIHRYDIWDYSYPYGYRPHIITCGTSTYTTSTGFASGGSCGSVMDCCAATAAGSFTNNNIAKDEGITVKGSDVNQNFSVGYTRELEDCAHVIILKLSGISDNGIEIKEPLTVKTKLECVTCGVVSKSNNRFCGNCGTSLNIY